MSFECPTMKKSDNEAINMKKRFEIYMVKQMSEKRFEIDIDHLLLVWDAEKNKRLEIEDIVDLLNKQEDAIITLKRRLEKINNGYGDLTHRNGLTANEWLIESQEKELKKKNEQISEWIEQHSKDIAKISEQNKLIQNLKEENDELKEKLDNIRREVINIDMFSDEALNHDIIAYREMHEFDNKDCYDIAWAIEKISKECFDE